MPARNAIHAIVDNYATHKHPKVQKWLARHPRWSFHFTPTSASWLNAVEGFFAKLTRRRLKRGVFRSVADLQAAINRFVTETNSDPKPFVWTANPKRILAAVKRGKETLELNPLETVQIAAIQTLHARAIRRETMELPPADLVVIDECHHALAKSWREIIDAYPEAVLLGLTATPCRGDGRGLGGIFETMIECPQVEELIQLGFLVRTRNYAPVDPDLSGVRTVAGDYVESQLADRMDRPKLIGDIVTHWHKYGELRKTVAFAVNVAHSIHLRDEFVRSGVRCEHIDGSTPKCERDATLARLASGALQVVTNCMVLTEGWDMPEASCCILARPTRKMGLYRQMIGRVLRPAEGKPDAIVLDHSGAVFRHGFVEDHVEWTLDPDRRAVSPTHQQREASGNSRLIECTQCGAVRVAGEACSHCDSCRSGRRALSISSMAISPWSTATVEQKPTSPIRLCVRSGTRNSLGSQTSVAISAAGLRTSSKKNSMRGRRGACSRCRQNHHRKFALGCAVAQSPLRCGGQHEETPPQNRRTIRAALDRDAAFTGDARPQSFCSPHSRPPRDRARQPRRPRQWQAAGHLR